MDLGALNTKPSESRFVKPEGKVGCIYRSAVVYMHSQPLARGGKGVPQTLGVENMASCIYNEMIEGFSCRQLDTA